jgi:hypothetical protein
MNIKLFYAELGKLLYAIADIDGVITRQEKDELHNLIASRLTQREIHTDEFGTNDAWYTEFEFDVAEEQGMASDEAFESFASFMAEHRHSLDSHMKDICLLLADKLASSFHHTNHREKLMLQKLKEVLYNVQNVHT